MKVVIWLGICNVSNYILCFYCVGKGVMIGVCLVSWSSDWLDYFLLCMQCFLFLFGFGWVFFNFYLRVFIMVFYWV